VRAVTFLATSAAGQHARATNRLGCPRDRPRSRGARPRLHRAAGGLHCALVRVPASLLTPTPLPVLPVRADRDLLAARLHPRGRQHQWCAHGPRRAAPGRRARAHAARVPSTLSPPIHRALSCGSRVALSTARARPAVNRVAQHAHGAGALALGPRRRPLRARRSDAALQRRAAGARATGRAGRAWLVSRSRAGPRALHLGRQHRPRAACRRRGAPVAQVCAATARATSRRCAAHHTSHRLCGSSATRRCRAGVGCAGGVGMMVPASAAAAPAGRGRHAGGGCRAERAKC
jgi:hypothetical protein